MQQTKAYWRLIAAAGIVGAFVASACVVTTGTDVNNNGGAAGSGSAGKGSSGAATAGASTAGAGTAGSGTAGAPPAGGAPAIEVKCDVDENSSIGSQPYDCTLLDRTNECEKCLEDKCCAEYSACYATEPGNQCGWGGPADATSPGEQLCMHTCIQEGIKMGGSDEDVFRTCAGGCATPKCGLLGNQTSALVACESANCRTQCFEAVQ